MTSGAFTQCVYAPVSRKFTFLLHDISVNRLLVKQHRRQSTKRSWVLQTFIHSFININNFIYTNHPHPATDTSCITRPQVTLITDQVVCSCSCYCLEQLVWKKRHHCQHLPLVEVSSIAHTHVSVTQVLSSKSWLCYLMMYALHTLHTCMPFINTYQTYMLYSWK